jgi:hypothetical protein
VNVINWSGRGLLFTFPERTHKKRARIKSVMYITDNTHWTGLQILASRGVKSLSGDV